MQHVPEARLESLLQRGVTTLGGMALKLAPTIAGTPDRLVLLPYLPMTLIELKTSKGRLSDIQEVWHERARALGHDPVVLAGRAEVLEWLRNRCRLLIRRGLLNVPPCSRNSAHGANKTIGLTGKLVCIPCARN